MGQQKYGQSTFCTWVELLLEGLHPSAIGGLAVFLLAHGARHVVEEGVPGAHVGVDAVALEPTVAVSDLPPLRGGDLDALLVQRFLGCELIRTDLPGGLPLTDRVEGDGNLGALVASLAVGRRSGHEGHVLVGWGVPDQLDLHLVELVDGLQQGGHPVPCRDEVRADPDDDVVPLRWAHTSLTFISWSLLMACSRA